MRGAEAAGVKRGLAGALGVGGGPGGGGGGGGGGGASSSGVMDGALGTASKLSSGALTSASSPSKASLMDVSRLAGWCVGDVDSDEESGEVSVRMVSYCMRLLRRNKADDSADCRSKGLPPAERLWPALLPADWLPHDGMIPMGEGGAGIEEDEGEWADGEWGTLMDSECECDGTAAP